MLQLKTRVAWIRKHDPQIFCLQETHLRTKDLHRLKVKGWKKYSNQRNRKKSQGSNTHIRQNKFQNKGHKKRPRRTIHNTQGKIPSGRHKHINIYAPNMRASKHIRTILEDLKKDRDSNTLIVGDFNIHWQ